jgi:hypothetical protein
VFLFLESFFDVGCSKLAFGKAGTHFYCKQASIE